MYNDYTYGYPLPQAPAQPHVNAQLQDDGIRISWDQNAELNTTEPLLYNRNNFEGYKLFKQYATNPALKSWSQKELVFQCDLQNSKAGHFYQV